MKNRKTAAILLALALAFSSAGCGAASGESLSSPASDILAQTLSSAKGAGAEDMPREKTPVLPEQPHQDRSRKNRRFKKKPDNGRAEGTVR